MLKIQYSFSEFVNELYSLKTKKETNESVKTTKNQILESFKGQVTLNQNKSI